MTVWDRPILINCDDLRPKDNPKPFQEIEPLQFIFVCGALVPSKNIIAMKMVASTFMRASREYLPEIGLSFTDHLQQVFIDFHTAIDDPNPILDRSNWFKNEPYSTFIKVCHTVLPIYFGSEIDGSMKAVFMTPSGAGLPAPDDVCELEDTYEGIDFYRLKRPGSLTT